MVGFTGVDSDYHLSFISWPTADLDHRGDMNIHLSSSILLLFCPCPLGSQQRTKTESRSVQNLSDVSSELAQSLSSNMLLGKAYPKTSPNSRVGEVVTTRLLMGDAVRWHHRSCWYRTAWNILAIFAGSLPSSIMLLPLRHFLSCSSSGLTDCEFPEVRHDILCISVCHVS